MNSAPGPRWGEMSQPSVSHRQRPCSQDSQHFMMTSVMLPHLVHNVRVGKVGLSEVDEAKLLPGPLRGVEDVGDVEPREEPSILRCPPVSDEEAGADLTNQKIVLSVLTNERPGSSYQSDESMYSYPVSRC